MCERLGVSQHALDALYSGEHQTHNGVKLSRSDRALIHFVRAMVMNPEVLVLHKPTVLVEKNQRKAVLQMMREFVRNRGMCVCAPVNA